MRYVCVLILLLLTIILYPVVSESRSVVEYSVRLKTVNESYFYRKLYSPVGNIETSTTTHVEYKVFNKIYFDGYDVNQTIISNCTGGWFIINTGSGINSGRIIHEPNGTCRTVTTEIDYADMSDYLSEAVIVATNLNDTLRLLTSKIGGNATVEVNIFLSGLQTYSGIPVFIATFNGSISVYNSTYGDITGYLTGYTYLHVGLLTPVKGYTKSVLIAQSLDYFVNSTNVIYYDIEDVNLPSHAQFAYMDLGYMEIVAGGLPGASIKVEAEKGSNTIRLYNYGDEYGYVLLNYKKPFKIGFKQVSKASVQGYVMIPLPPRSNTTVETPITFDRDIVLNSETIRPGIPVEYVIAGVIIAAISITGWLIYSKRRKTT